MWLKCIGAWIVTLPTPVYILQLLCSPFAQVLVGIMLIFKGRLDSASGTMSSTANGIILVDAVQLNNYVVLGVFLITVINIFIAAFTVAPTWCYSSDTPYTIPCRESQQNIIDLTGWHQHLSSPKLYETYH